MPGLKELENFRDELSKIGNEREVVAERGDVYEEFPMPTAVSASSSQLDVDNLLASIGDNTAEEKPPASADLSGFDELLASLPLETPAEPGASKAQPGAPKPQPAAPKIPPVPPKSQPAAPKAQPAEQKLPSSESFEMPDFGSGTVPDALLSGFANEIEEGRKDTDEFQMPDFGADMLSGFPETEPTASAEEIPEAEAVEEISSEPVLSEEPVNAIEGLDALLAAGLPSIDENEPAAMDFTPSFEMENTPAQGSAAKVAPEECGSVVPEEVGFETPGEISNIEIPDFGDFGTIEEPAAAPSEEPAAGEDIFSDIQIPDFGQESAETPAAPAEFEAPAAASSPYGAEFNDFSIPDDLKIDETAAESAGEAPELDGFDGFSLDEDFLKTSADNVAGGEEEFHIPGFSDFTSDGAKAPLGEISAVSEALHKGGKKEIPLKISEKEFVRFLELLSAFPLNLRIAIEEYLSGDIGTELQKMEVVHSILAQIPIRKIAKGMETAFDRSIAIPHDFEKKNVSDYEHEKSSLKYVFRNRILPAATLFTIIAVLAACTVFLAKTFIYEPIVAEILYSSGYAAIGDARYTQSVSLFDEAVSHWDRKSWYYRYARAYRDKKQYITAEMFYERMLDRFKNDKKAGLEYAEMLRTDLRNFEKAETILKRRLLDNFVNDKDALLLLGDTYLDWADEAPDKFESARQTYAMLIQLYGSQDTYLARMMRYFIRTDKLAQVLPLKDHFMNKRAKIGASDLVELSGYLLEKRYNPAPGDSERIRDSIDDVRPLLERAVKADSSVPEAHYNIGKFFIYNYKNKLATTAFNEALHLFDRAKTMSPRRVLTHVDTYRLLGEVCVENKEYLKAQTLYADGITLYEDQRANQSVHQDSRVGTLYSDFADIDYFISGNLDSALENYSKATEELHDTPSIRYRIGYIQYQKQDYEAAMNSFVRAHADMPDDRNLQYGFANTFFRRGDIYAAQGYYETLMDSLEAERVRKGIVFPQVRPEQVRFVEQYMYAANNLGVTLNRIALRTGDSQKNARAFALLSDSIRAWDALTRDQYTLSRSVPGTNLAYLNVQNMAHPLSTFQPEIYADIPKTLQNEKVLKQTEDE